MRPWFASSARPSLIGARMPQDMVKLRAAGVVSFIHVATVGQPDAAVNPAVASPARVLAINTAAQEGR